MVMNNSPKVTIIIPVYNVEQYLRRCVDSVLNQTYANLEVILVDDGSTDGSPTICDEYSRQDNRVTALHKKNGGQSSARNLALANQISGDIVTFIDSDDWIAPDAYEYGIRLMTHYQSDCVQYEIYITDSPELSVVQPKEHVVVYEGKDVLQFFMMRSTIASGGYSMCVCLCQKQLLDGLRFRDGKINEDIDYKCKVMKRCKRLVVSNQMKYFYFQSGDSTSGAGLRVRDFQLRDAAEILYNLTKDEEYGSIAFLGKVKKARTAFSLLSKIAYFGIADPLINKRQTVKELTAEHRKNVCILLKAPIPISRKVLAVMFALNYKMTEIAIHLAKKL